MLYTWIFITMKYNIDVNQSADIIYIIKSIIRNEIFNFKRKNCSRKQHYKKKLESFKPLVCFGLFWNKD